jgi:hypothetical protein
MCPCVPLIEKRFYLNVLLEIKFSFIHLLNRQMEFN